MKPIAACVIAVTLFMVCLPSFVFADTISLGDYSQPDDFLLLQEDGEVLAPALLSLTHAGYEYIMQGKTLILKTPAGREVILRLGEKKALVEGTEVELKAAPRLIQQRCYLPLGSLAEPLGLTATRDKEKRTLVLTPRLEALKVESAPERTTVFIGAQVKLGYTLGQLTDPPRVFIDIENIALVEKAQKIDVNAGALLAIRAAAQSATRPGIRIVMDLSGPVKPRIKTSHEGCLLEIEIPKQTSEQPVAGAILQTISFRRISGSMAAIALGLSAPTTLQSEVMKDGKEIVVKIFSASKLEEAPNVKGDRLIESLDLHPVGDGAVQELHIALKQKTGHLLTQNGKTARVLIGSFSLDGLKVVLDPGHGGCMSGAVGRSGMMEKDVNLAVGLKLEKLLKDAGAKVYLTRNEDCELRPIPKGKGGVDRSAWRAELRMRPALANSVKADLFISMHCNANGDNGRRTGTEIYYWTPFSEMLAQTIREELVKSLGRNDGGIFGSRDFWVIKEGVMPSVLVEMAYMDNQEEESLLATEEFQTLAAKGIFAGVSRYVKSGGVLGSQAVPSAVPISSKEGE